MFEESVNERITEILIDRVSTEYGIAVEEASVLADLLVNECGLAPQEALALAEGEPVHLAMEPIGRVADTFSLSSDLLSCLLTPVSTEILLHTITEVANGQFNTPDCELCVALEERATGISSDDDHEELLMLSVDLLEHLIFFDESSENMLDTSLAQQTVIPLAGALSAAMVELDAEAQKRVLAYAYQELAESTDGRAASHFAAYAKLRQTQQLTTLTRQTLDLLANAPEGALTGAQVTDALQLSDARCLNEVENSLRSAVCELALAGTPLPEPPVIISGSGSAMHLRLTANARAAWRALSRADTSL